MADRMQYPQYHYSNDYHQISGYQNEREFTAASVQPRGKNSGVLRRIIFLMFFVVSALITAEMIFRFAIAPRMAISKIVLEGDFLLSEEEILDLCGITPGDLYFSVETEGIRQALLQLPDTREVEVEKQFPGVLTISLMRRVPLAFASMQGGGAPVVADAEGVVFARGIPEDYESLPVISGFEISQVALGSKLPRAMQAVLHDLEELRMQHPVLFRLISEIECVPVHEHRYELIVYFVHVPVPVKIGSTLQAEKLSGIIRVLEVLQRQEAVDGIMEIDFRGDDVVYTRRED